MYKIWRLEDFSVYLDSDAEILIQSSQSSSTVPSTVASEESPINMDVGFTPKKLVQKMRDFESRAVSGSVQIASVSQSKPHAYIIGQISLEAKVKRNISELPLKSRYEKTFGTIVTDDMGIFFVYTKYS
jgi:hypothetical protein